MGGGDTSAQRQAQAREDQEKRRISSGIGRVNSIIDSKDREAQRQDFLKAVQSTYQAELDKQHGNASRENIFALARAGQTGSSLARDNATELGENYQRGVLEAERGAQESVAGLRAADEDTRARLISLIQSGGDIGAASSNAATQMRNNLQAGRAGVRVDQFGDIFGNFTKLAAKSKEQADYRRGLKQGVNLYEAGPWAAPTGWGE